MTVIPFTPRESRPHEDDLDDLEGGLDLLEIAAQTLPGPDSNSGALPLDEVARDLGYGMEDMHRLANVLKTRHYISSDLRSGDVTLTRKLFDLSLGHSNTPRV